MTTRLERLAKALGAAKAASFVAESEAEFSHGNITIKVRRDCGIDIWQSGSRVEIAFSDLPWVHKMLGGLLEKDDAKGEPSANH